MGTVSSKGPPSPYFKTVKDIPNVYFEAHRTILGHVVKVVDGDSIRCRHVQKHLFLAKKPPPYTGEIKDTLAIRLYGVDAPETKNGPRPGQPFADEAKMLLKEKILGEVVILKLLAKDTYGRAIARVRYHAKRGRGAFGLKTKKDLSDLLLKSGYATLYTGYGAEYDQRKRQMEAFELRAKKEKKGIWSLDDEEYESPAEYKMRIRKTQK